MCVFLQTHKQPQKKTEREREERMDWCTISVPFRTFNLTKADINKGVTNMDYWQWDYHKSMIQDLILLKKNILHTVVTVLLAMQVTTFCKSPYRIQKYGKYHFPRLYVARMINDIKIGYHFLPRLCLLSIHDSFVLLRLFWHRVVQ